MAAQKRAAGHILRKAIQIDFYIPSLGRFSSAQIWVRASHKIYRRVSVHQYTSVQLLRMRPKSIDWFEHCVRGYPTNRFGRVLDHMYMHVSKTESKNKTDPYIRKKNSRTWTIYLYLTIYAYGIDNLITSSRLHKKSSVLQK